MARVLVCDDEEAMRGLLARAVRGLGHEAIEAGDGAQALERLVRDAGAFDLLLSDIRMPVMDGIALALNVARDYPAMPIILTTGYAEQRERASDLKALIFDVISKPFSLVQLQDLVTAALASRGAGRTISGR